jgi:hypothetical protein
MKVVLDGHTPDFRRIEFVKLVRTHTGLKLRQAKGLMEDLIASGTLVLEGEQLPRDPMAFLPDAMALGVGGYIEDDNGQQVRVVGQPRRSSVTEHPGVAARQTRVWTREVLDRVERDPLVAWNIIHKLRKTKLLGPWEQDPIDQDTWFRRTADNLTFAWARWHRDQKGEVQSASGRIVPFIGADPDEDETVADIVRPRSYPTVATAMLFTDKRLEDAGWTLVPPFGRSRE